MKYLTKNKDWNIAEDYDKEKLLYLLIDRPTEIDYADFIWWINNTNKIHRNYDMPACVWNTYELLWYENDNIFRKNKKSAFI